MGWGAFIGAGIGAMYYLGHALWLAESLSADELAAEITLLEAHDARAVQDLADATWTLEMFRGFSAACRSPRTLSWGLLAL
ncbi:hypothetical protein ACFPH6_20375 [Streptomyces xiangluensis]|uniref:Uncharacterized protein n=1 Tax=Streptomyces xiangluensis TaxID=2665720 RepID=A0ABV8YRT2_9ACTN